MYIFDSEVITSYAYSSNWITLLVLCTSAPLVLGCDQFRLDATKVYSAEKKDRTTLNPSTIDAMVQSL